MIVTFLRLNDFRNYDSFELKPHPALTVLVGPNAVGKTNIIEALQLLTTASSFRRARWEDLVRWGSDSAAVALRAADGERQLDVSLVARRDGTKEFTVNNQVRKRSGDVAGRLPSVVFTPDDLELVKGPAERRRAAIDDLGAQLSSAYASLRRDFGKVVRQRNTLLREDAPQSQLAPWDDQLSDLGGRLLTHRMRLLARLMVAVSRRYADLAGDELLGWAYDDRCGLAGARGGRGTTEPPTPEQASEAISAELKRRASEERRRATSLVGPHRDDIVFLLGGREARVFASQGQQRTAALAWKMAEVALIEEVLHTRPLLLLDDVMSELDEDRRRALGSLITDRTQTFVTTTNIGYFDPRITADATIVELGR